MWGTGYLCDLRRLESVQRSWTKEVDGLGNAEYGSRLRELGLFSIWGRMHRCELVKVWKCFNTEAGTGVLELFEKRFHSSTRGHTLKLSLPRCRTEVRRRFWSVRVVDVWNELPASVVEAESLTTFKARLDSYMGERFYNFV